MKFFAGIVPPEDIYSRIVQIQQQYGDNRLEPHITLRPPVNPLQDNDWLDAIASVASSIKPFTVQLTGSGYFGKRVLFISVASEPLKQLYNLLVPALKAFEPQDDGKGTEKFHPHLTLGRAWCGFTPDDFKKMQQLADQYLLAKYVSFEATHIRVYHKPEHNGRFKPYKDIRLG